jgi:hypothetical protein
MDESSEADWFYAMKWFGSVAPLRVIAVQATERFESSEKQRGPQHSG